MYGCESWTIKKADLWRIDTFELWCPESPLDCKEVKPVNPRGNQSWIFIGRTDAEAETLTLWPPDVKNWLTGKDPDIGKDWRQEKGISEDEMVGWHHWLDGHEFEQAPGVGDGQGSLACCSPWGCKEWDTTEWTKLTWRICFLQISHLGATEVLTEHGNEPPVLLNGLKNSWVALGLASFPIVPGRMSALQGCQSQEQMSSLEALCSVQALDCLRLQDAAWPRGVTAHQALKAEMAGRALHPHLLSPPPLSSKIPGLPGLSPILSSSASTAHPM